MKKLFRKLFSYKAWSYAAAIVTVLMAIPVLKECMKKLPTIDVSVGKYWVTDEEKSDFAVCCTKHCNRQIPSPYSSFFY